MAGASYRPAPIGGRYPPFWVIPLCAAKTQVFLPHSRAPAHTWPSPPETYRQDLSTAWHFGPSLRGVLFPGDTPDGLRKAFRTHHYRFVLETLFWASQHLHIH